MKPLSTTLSKIILLAALVATPAYAQMNDHSGHDMDRMLEMRQSHMVEALATVTSVYPAEDKIGLAHPAIPEINWPAMTMDFAVPPSVDVEGLSVGDKVQFTLHRAADGSLPLVELCKTSLEAVKPALCAPMKMGHGHMHGDKSHMSQKSDGHTNHQGH